MLALLSRIICMIVGCAGGTLGGRVALWNSMWNSIPDSVTLLSSEDLMKSCKQSALAQAIQPLAEALESRRLLSASINNGILVVTGTKGSDNINVSLGSGEAPFRVRVNGSEAHFNLGGVKGILIRAGNGRDE